MGKAYTDNPKNNPEKLRRKPTNRNSKSSLSASQISLSAVEEGAKPEKAKLDFKDGSAFDGFTVNGNLHIGRFYFANGDFY